MYNKSSRPDDRVREVITFCRYICAPLNVKSHTVAFSTKWIWLYDQHVERYEKGAEITIHKNVLVY